MKKKIVVCSKNKSKNKAVEEVVSKFFSEYEIVPLETNSGVSETPIGDEEGLTGCKNRILDARRQVEEADIYISMEGILTECSYGTYLCGWTMVYDKKADEYCTGCSAKVKVPDEIIKMFQKMKDCQKLWLITQAAQMKKSVCSAQTECLQMAFTLALTNLLIL